MEGVKVSLQEVWGAFVSKFCEADVFCYQGDINWLGYVVLIVGGLYLLGGFIRAWLDLDFS